MTGTYDIWLVGLSILVAVIASYVALDLASRVVASQGSKAARYWLVGGAISMGTGIWSMHFIGMLAFRLPIPMSYNIPITLISLLIAALVSGFALNTVSHGALSVRRLLVAGLLMGIGIASMHYTGMAAMELDPPIRYDPLLFSASVLIAIAASVVALWIAFQLRSETILSAFWTKLGSALVMGAAVAGMHYTGMTAANFAPNTVCSVSPQDINNVWLASAIGGFTFLFLATTLLISVFDARLADHSAKLAEKLRRVNADLEKARRFLSSVVDNIPNMIFVKDAKDLKYIHLNKAGEQLMGFSEQELLGKNDGDFFPRAQADSLMAKDRETLGIGHHVSVMEERLKSKDGSEKILQTKKLPILDENGNPQYLLGISEDITERKKTEQQLVLLAQYDTLTGLPNRTLFRDRLSLAMARARRNEQLVALMFLDLDRFKEINDTLGHTIGDQVLQAVAALLRRTLRDTDTVARLGGDEFTVILESLSHVDEIKMVTEKIQRVFTNPLLIQGREIFVTASVGITIYPFSGTEIDDLLQAADIAMYRAKEEGGNAYEFYSPEIKAQTVERLEMEVSLRRAVEKQEFILHYQPKVSVNSGRISGAEALIRWNLKELGPIPPAQFIPLAEKIGLILPIGEWVLRTACAQCKAWQDQGLPELLMSVNLSPRQFRQKNLVEMITGVLEDTGLDPRLLELEITEGTIMYHAETAVALLQQLHLLGVQLSVDDFGTGYSSLAYLKRFPVQRLKIDQSFVRDLTTNADDASIVAAVIAMAKSLKLGVVAEGVETREQLAFLAGLHCDDYQGYYFSRPVPAEEFGRLFKNTAEAGAA
jgi:diguanylate cyclase (GGDEF)-like protein/PAS domain S-box-containing protein